MSENLETIEAPVNAPAKRKKRAVKKAAPKPKAEAKEANPFAGITAKDCPAACTPERCCISTVAICAHPLKSAANGFGPVTMTNREKARKMIKHQMVDARG